MGLFPALLCTTDTYSMTAMMAGGRNTDPQGSSRTSGTESPCDPHQTAGGGVESNG